MEIINSGDKVILQLNNKIVLEGIASFNCEKYITLAEGACIDHQKQTDHPLNIYKPEILSIRKLVKERKLQETETDVNKTDVSKTLRIGQGDKIEITLIDHIIRGTVVACNETSIQLVDCVDQLNNVNVFDNTTFFRYEIKSVTLLSKSKLTAVIENGTPTKRIALDEEEFIRIRDMANEYILIRRKDKAFQEAVIDLINSESVGVISLGNNFKLITPMSLLLMCTFKKVYVFDILAIGLDQELLNIIEHDGIMKVMHNCTCLLYYLHNKHKTRINNIFDTQTADYFLQKEGGEKNAVRRNLSECLFVHFNFPENFLTTALEDVEKNWDSRPLLRVEITRASQLVSYLILLKDHLMKLMLKDFYSFQKEEVSIERIEEKIEDAKSW